LNYVLAPEKRANIWIQNEHYAPDLISFILTASAKRNSNLLRRRAIQEAAHDGNPHALPDPDWMPLLRTPPFPEYISGHSTFSGAAAVVLALFYGTDQIPFSLESDDLSGIRRFYSSFPRRPSRAE
jgi:hypothetical protein